MESDPKRPLEQQVVERTRRLRRAAKWTILTGAAIFILVLSIVVGFSVIRPTVPHVDAVIVLGAKVGTPALTARALQGLKYYQEGKVNTIVLSGGRGADEPISEAVAMQRVIQHQIAQTGGRPPKLILESKSVNTFQNIHNSKLLIPNAKSVVIVSDCFHLARPVLLAKRDGFRQVYWSAPSPSYYSISDLFYYYVREVAGMVSYVPKFITNT
ncbi:MAG TPA: YdcF family protein [Verrucomicrobiae bacterium]|nr:YdcF family protein [Verrucomicrobiae bacterium]